MLNKKVLKNMINVGRSIGKAKSGDDELGVLQLLPGVWKNKGKLKGAGWNMIALPFIADKKKDNLDYRLLVNQYNEELSFTTVDKAVANRGIEGKRSALVNSDQFVIALDYTQQIVQSAADDFPKSGEAGKRGLAIHHEPGLFLQMTDHFEDDLQLARLASIPHGNSVLALGKTKTKKGGPKIPDENGLPIGVEQNLDSPYLRPYKHYNDKPFRKVFNPVHPNELLKKANEDVKIARTTVLHFDTKFGTGGIHNIPFIEKQADASEMYATFWIQELAEKDKDGKPKLRLQYTQTVMLDFFKRTDGKKGLIKWPHVSINTLEKVK